MSGMTRDDGAPLLGRLEEQSLMTSLLDDVAARGQALVVRGEPGIGKSRLLSMCERTAGERGMAVLSTTGVQSEANLPFAGLHQLLRPVRGRTGELRDVQRAALDAAFGLTDEGAPEHFRIPMAALDLNRTPGKACVLAADGADLAETPADAVREAAFVITMLTDTDAILAVMGHAAESIPDGAVWLQTSMDTDVERVAGLAKGHGIPFVNCPVIGTRETAKQARLVVLASGPGDALDRAQPIFGAIGSKTVRLEPEAGGVSRMKLVVSAWTAGIVESLGAQLNRAARWARSRTSTGR